MALGYFLRTSTFPAQAVSPQVLEAAARQLDPARWRPTGGWRSSPSTRPTTPSARGARRARGGATWSTSAGCASRRRAGTGVAAVAASAPGRLPRHAAATGSTVAPVATTSGYVDVCGPGAQGQAVAPAGSRPVSNRHPTFTSQNGERQCSAAGRCSRARWAAILVADPASAAGLLVALVTERRDFVIRVDADVTVFTPRAAARARCGVRRTARARRGRVRPGQRARCGARPRAHAVRFTAPGAGTTTRKRRCSSSSSSRSMWSPIHWCWRHRCRPRCSPTSRGGPRVRVEMGHPNRVRTMKGSGLGRFMVPRSDRPPALARRGGLRVARRRARTPPRPPA